MSNTSRFITAQPCDNCPFTRDAGAIRLTKARTRALATNAASFSGGGFHCHKTTEDDDEGDRCITPDSLQCAGSVLFGLNCGVMNQHTRIMYRIGAFDPKTLRGRDRVFKSKREMMARALQ